MKLSISILFIFCFVVFSCKAETTPKKTNPTETIKVVQDADTTLEDDINEVVPGIKDEPNSNDGYKRQGDFEEQVVEKTEKPVEISENEELIQEPDSSNTEVNDEEFEIEAKNIESSEPEENIEEFKTQEEENTSTAVAGLHDIWDQLLKKYVSSSGKVNYKGLKTDESKLDAYLDLLAKNPLQDKWPRARKMAYWINVYNAFTVKLILDNFPISSIMKIDGGQTWERSWIKLGGKTYSLNQIENGILRPQFGDARIHFAVNCAAQSCPALYNGAWTDSNIESLLEAQTKKFINNKDFNSISADKLVLSKIFDWYKDDFGNLVDYISKYSNVKVSPKAKISFMDYDWALNQ